MSGVGYLGWLGDMNVVHILLLTVIYLYVDHKYTRRNYFWLILQLQSRTNTHMVFLIDNSFLASINKNDRGELKEDIKDC